MLFEMDTLYAELARLFVEGLPAAQRSPEITAQFKELAVAKYLQICEKRKSLNNAPEPVLSLEIHDAAEQQVELVIYRGYQEYIHQYPKLQRALAKTSLQLREV